MGKPAVCKRRLPKAYRIRLLDYKLRSGRTVTEAKILALAKNAGVKCPLVYFADPVRAEIIEQRLEGSLLSRLPKAQRNKYARNAGELLAKLHSAGIYHGDYTTTNLMLCADGLQVIDFGLAEYSAKSEDFATDVLLYKKSVGKGEFGLFWNGYEEAFPTGYKNTKASLADIESRGRYVARKQ